MSKSTIGQRYDELRAELHTLVRQVPRPVLSVLSLVTGTRKLVKEMLK